MPGAPSRRIFGLFNVYRFALALLIAWVVLEAPHYHVPLPIGWPLVGFLFSMMAFSGSPGALWIS